MRVGEKIFFLEMWRDCPPGTSQERGDSGWGEGRPEVKIKRPSRPPPTPACVAWYLLLTSASFQSPGMQKDSSRSLPHSSKIRSSEEGDSLQRE